MDGRKRILRISSPDAHPDTSPVVDIMPGIEIETATSVVEGLRWLAAKRFEAVLAEFPIPNWTPAELLEEGMRADAMAPFLLLDPEGSLADAVRLTKLGAFHFFGSGTAGEAVETQLEAAVEYRRSLELALLQEATSQEPWRRYLVGESRAMANICHIVRLIAKRRCTALITGETGTGKEVIARALHMASNRSHLPLVAVNCSALPENLLEAELFGHVKGAFTGAINHRIGRFEQAHRSSIFLDEIGDMPLELQAKLLRVLQEREFQRIGSSETIKVDIRVLAASNADLTEKVRNGEFREDLYYRLNVVPIHVPPLRERLCDIPALIQHFIDKVCRMEEIPPKQVTVETLDRLATYSWPGNVRQLENAVEMAVALSGDRVTLYPADFPLPSLVTAKPVSAVSASNLELPDDGLDYEQTVSSFERCILEQALRRTDGNKKRAADMLRLKRTTLTAKLKSLEATA
jgi:DNA-binding NtrC family response regulator